MKIRKAVLLLACAVSWGIAVWFAGRLWAAYPLVSVRSDVPVTGRQLEALRSALRQEDGASALVPAFWSQAEGSAESRWETCGITAILYCGEYDAVYPAVLLEGRFPAAQENGKCAVSTAAAWQLWGSEDVLGQELEIEGDIYRVCGLFRSSASLALCGESLDHGFSNIEFWGGYAAPPVETVQQLLRAAGIAQQVTLYFPFPWMAALTAYASARWGWCCWPPPAPWAAGCAGGAQRKRAGLFWAALFCLRSSCPPCYGCSRPGSPPPGGATFPTGAACCPQWAKP